MDKPDDVKTKITDKLSQIYINTFLSKVIKKDSFKAQLMKRLKFFKKKLENKNKTKKKRSILGKIGKIGKIGNKLAKTVKNLKEKGQKLIPKRSKNVPPNN